MTDAELISTLNTAAESVGGNIALAMLLKIAAERIQQLSNNSSE